MDHSIPDREVSEFLLRACHDARASARAIRTHAELFLRDGDLPDSDSNQRIGFIVEGARAIDLLIDGLAGYAVALHTKAGSFQSIHTDVLLRFVLARLEKELRECGAEVFYSGLPLVSGDPDRLMQVFENLLRNALIHRRGAVSRIDISAGAHADGWLFTVRDNGPGIDEASLESVFQPFQRLHGKQGGGPGLGLTICRAIVERHGGRIWAESQPGNGTTIRFTLPAPEL